MTTRLTSSLPVFAFLTALAAAVLWMMACEPDRMRELPAAADVAIHPSSVSGPEAVLAYAAYVRQAPGDSDRSEEQYLVERSGGSPAP